MSQQNNPSPGTREAAEAEALAWVLKECGEKDRGTTWWVAMQKYFLVGFEKGHAHAQGEIEARIKQMLACEHERGKASAEGSRLTAANTRLQERCERLERALEKISKGGPYSTPHPVDIACKALEKGGANAV